MMSISAPVAQATFSIPRMARHHPGTWASRSILRRAMQNILPPAVQWRADKSNLGPNFKHTLLTFDREILDDVILRDPDVLQEYVDTNALRATYQRYLARWDADDEMTIWRAVSLAVWLRRAEPSFGDSKGGDVKITERSEQGTPSHTNDSFKEAIA